MHDVILTQKRLKRIIPVTHGGIFHIYGLVKYCAYYWLNKIPPDETGRLQLEAQAMPTNYMSERVQNNIFTITCKDHYTQRSTSIILELLAKWSRYHVDLNRLAQNKTDYKSIPLKSYLFWGKCHIQTMVFATHGYNKAMYYKNFIISKENTHLHVIITRSQKLIKPWSISDEKRGLLFPLHEKDVFATNLLEQFHDMYCGKDTIYPISKLFSQQLYHPRMKMLLTSLNKTCPSSCLSRALTLDKRYKMFSPSGLGGSLQLTLTKNLPQRSSSIVLDMVGPYKVKCQSKKCLSKIFLLIIVNAITNFVEIEILDNQSAASVIAALIRYMSHHGSKHIFLSDMGSNFFPLANRFATSPDKQIGNLPPMWKKLLTSDLELLRQNGGYLWLMYAKDRHEAVNRVELVVNKVKIYLKKARVLEHFKSGQYTRSEVSVILASVSTTLNTRPLAIFQNEIISPETFHFHS